MAFQTANSCPTIVQHEVITSGNQTANYFPTIVQPSVTTSGKLSTIFQFNYCATIYKQNMKSTNSKVKHVHPSTNYKVKHVTN